MKNIAVISWLAGIVLSIASVPISMYLTDAQWMDPQAYRFAIPSLYFVSVSLTAMASADWFAIALRSNMQDLGSNGAGKVALAFISNLFFFLFSLVVFCKTVIDLQKAGTSVSWTDLAILAVWLILSLISAYICKLRLESQIVRAE